MDRRRPSAWRIGAISVYVVVGMTSAIPGPALADENKRSITAAVHGLDLTVFRSNVTIASSSAAIDGKAAARARGAGVSTSRRTLASGKATESNKREFSKECLAELAVFEVVRAQMACGESRVQTLPPLVPDDYRQPTGAALLGRLQPARERTPNPVENGGAQAVGRGSVSSVAIQNRGVLEPRMAGLQALLDSLIPMGERTVEAAGDAAGPALRRMLDPLAGSLGLGPDDKVSPVARLLGQLLEGAKRAPLLASITLAESSSQANTGIGNVIALAATGGGQVDLLPGFGHGGTPLLSVIAGPARSVSTFDRATAARVSNAEPAETRIMLGLPIAGAEVAELVVRPGAPVTLLAGTPLETTISAGQGRTNKSSDGSVLSSVEPTTVQFLSAVKGGIAVQLGQVDSAVGAEFDADGEARRDAGIDGSLAIAAGCLLVATSIAALIVVLCQGRTVRRRNVGAEG